MLPPSSTLTSGFESEEARSVEAFSLVMPKDFILAIVDIIRELIFESFFSKFCMFEKLWSAKACVFRIKPDINKTNKKHLPCRIVKTEKIFLFIFLLLPAFYLL